MEYVRTNHLVLAQYFLRSALNTSAGDPLCWHELGVLELLQGNFDKAILYFQSALYTLLGVQDTGNVRDCLEHLQDRFWEPTVYNLGHAFRKSRKYIEAQHCFERCVALCPDSCSTWAALALSKHLRADTDSAIEHYHQALSCKPDDPFSTEMLHRALRESMSEQLKISDEDKISAIGVTTPGPSRSLGAAMSSATPMSSLKDDSVMSEDMESDVDMG